MQTQNDFVFSPSEVFCQSDTDSPFYQCPPDRAACSGHDFFFQFVESFLEVGVFHKSLRFQPLTQSNWDPLGQIWALL